MKYIKHRLFLWLVKDLFCGLLESDILTEVKGKMRYRGKTLSPDEAEQIKTDAQRFKDSLIWKMLSDEVRWNANYIMYTQSKDFDGMIFGKAALWAVDVLDKVIARLSR